MPKYVVTAKRFVDHPKGSIIELTEEKAATPLFRNRVRLSDDQSSAELVVATPTGGAPAKTEDEQKEELIAQLKELGVQADKRSSVETLQEKLDEALTK